MEEVLYKLRESNFKEAAAESPVEGCITYFQCKLLVYRSFGSEIKVKEIVNLMKNQERNVDIPPGYITEEEFHTILIPHVMREFGITQTTLQHMVYRRFDSSRRGYVDELGLKKALLSNAKCAQLAENHGTRLFNALDELEIGKISLTQVMSILGRGANVLSHG